MNITLIRGLSREKFHWGEFSKDLQISFPQSDIEMLDLPGNGDWAAEKCPLSPRAVVDFLRKQSRFIQNRRKTNIIAVSLGAMLAHQWSISHSEEIESLVLINTSLRPSPFYHRIKPTGLLKMISAARTQELFEREKKVLELTTNLLGPTIDRLASEWAERAKFVRTSGENTLRQLIVAAQMRRDSTSPPVKTLILSSRGDALVDPIASVAIANEWGGPHRIHPSAGHDLTLDAPEWTLAQLKDFYSSLDRGVRS